MSSAAHAVSLLLAVALAYLWLQVPVLRDHSLQIFAVMMISFFVLKRLRKAKLWHIAPEPGSWELSLITFSFLLLIGATGNTDSIFYPLGFLHLFFLVLASTVPTAIVATTGIMLFHYAMEPSFNLGHLQVLITLPTMLVLFIFTKYQYDQSRFKQNLLKEEEKVINALTNDDREDQQDVSQFVNDYLPSQFATIRQLAQQSPQFDAISKILQRIEQESAALLKKIATQKPKQ